jgi:threonine/homoserine/homoserine lactone efflux protein
LSKYLLEFGTIAIAHFLALISPGPDFFLIVGTSVREGVSRTMGVCFGIAAANGLYILAALTGFAILRNNPLFFGAMKAMGALYLIYLGFMLLKASKLTICRDAASQYNKPNKSWSQLFGMGFLSAILNPKNAIFYLSLFTVIVDKNTPQEIQAIYGLWMFCAVLCWDLLIVWSIGSARVKGYLNNQTHRIEKASGGTLLILGVILLFR